jgi:hypothetical protein
MLVKTISRKICYSSNYFGAIYKNILQSNKSILGTNYTFRYMNLRRANFSENTQKIKFTQEQVEAYLDSINQEIHRSLEKLPSVFKKCTEVILRMPDKPTEPDEYQCCGKGCSSCVYDVFDRNKRLYEESIQIILEKINEV